MPGARMFSTLIFVLGASVGGVSAWLWSASQARAVLASKIANLRAIIGGRDTTITELRSQVAEQAEAARAAPDSHVIVLLALVAGILIGCSIARWFGWDRLQSKQRVSAIEPRLDGLHHQQVGRGEKCNRCQHRHW